jgi:uncharacterized protein
MNKPVNHISKIILALFLVLLIHTAVAQAKSYLPALPNPPKLVTDFAGMLTPAQVESLEQKLKMFNDSSTNEIAIVTVNNLADRDVETYANELYRAWGIGGKKNNNGVLVLVAKDDRKSRIEVGYGLEGALPDLIASEIIRYDMNPNFKQGNFYQGLDAATDNIIAATKNEYQADPNMPVQTDDSGIPVIAILLMFLLFFLFLRMMQRRSTKYYMSGRGHRGWDNNNGPFGGGFGGGFIGGGGFFDGGDSGGGFGGGGFGGFGGGSSGGGGASGSW